MQKDRDKDRDEEDTLGFTFYNKESKRKDGRGKENVCDHEDNAKIILEKVAERDQKG